MRMAFLITLVLYFCMHVFSTRSSAGSDGDSGGVVDTAALDIDGVMRHTMTKGLCQKVIQNKATPEEQQKLVEMFHRLAELKPPKGTQESWDSLTKQLILASTEVMQGEPSHKKLREAANCAACHREHRPK